MMRWPYFMHLQHTDLVFYSSGASAAPLTSTPWRAPPSAKRDDFVPKTAAGPCPTQVRRGSFFLQPWKNLLAALKECPVDHELPSARSTCGRTKLKVFSPQEVIFTLGFVSAQDLILSVLTKILLFSYQRIFSLSKKIMLLI